MAYFSNYWLAQTMQTRSESSVVGFLVVPNPLRRKKIKHRMNTNIYMCVLSMYLVITSNPEKWFSESDSSNAYDQAHLEQMHK